MGSIVTVMAIVIVLAAVLLIAFATKGPPNKKG
jgi:hypothetical protein